MVVNVMGTYKILTEAVEHETYINTQQMYKNAKTRETAMSDNAMY